MSSKTRRHAGHSFKCAFRSCHSVPESSPTAAWAHSSSNCSCLDIGHLPSKPGLLFPRWFGFPLTRGPLGFEELANFREPAIVVMACGRERLAGPYGRFGKGQPFKVDHLDSFPLLGIEAAEGLIDQTVRFARFESLAIAELLHLILCHAFAQFDLGIQLLAIEVFPAVEATIVSALQYPHFECSARRVELCRLA